MKKLIILIFSVFLIFTGCSSVDKKDGGKNNADKNGLTVINEDPTQNKTQTADTSEFKITTEGKFLHNDFYDVSLYYPNITGGSGAEKITHDINELNNEKTEMIKKLYNQYSEENILTQIYLDTYFDYSLFRDLLSVKYTVYEFFGGAHGETFIYTYNIKGSKNGTFTLSDMFNDGVNYKDIVDKIICDEISKNKDKYFPESEKTVWQTDYNNKFYINNKGEIVIYFSEYELAPYAAGTIEFKIKPQDIRESLKEEYFTALNTMGISCIMKFNGEPKELRNMPRFSIDDYGYEECFVPLRELCEIIGYTVTDDKAGNLLVNDKNILEFGKPIMVGDIEYVPFEMFNNFDRILNKDFRSKIIYDNGIINVYKVKA